MLKPTLFKRRLFRSRQPDHDKAHKEKKWKRKNDMHQVWMWLESDCVSKWHKKSGKKQLRMKTHWSESIWPRENKREKKERTKKKGIGDLESTHAAFRDSSTERMWQTGRNKTKPQQCRKKATMMWKKKHTYKGMVKDSRTPKSKHLLSYLPSTLSENETEKKTRATKKKKNATKVEGCS